MTNLLKETIEELKDNGKTPNDVRWVGTIDGKTTWDNFAKLADEEYDSGFGGEEVRRDLLVVGDKWWLERHEYDGSEWWEYKELPKEPEQVDVKKYGDRYGDDEKSLYIFYD